jgi:pimeloyl-ACP methyl ester carboxylesterase
MEISHGRPAPTAYERLEKIAVPTLIIVGDKDTSAILDCDEYMARKIPGARKTQYGKTGRIQ